MNTKVSSAAAAIVSLLLLIISSSVASTATIFNDFGPGDTFQFSQAAPVAGSNSVFGYHAFAMPFTSPFEANVTQIDLGLTLTGGVAGGMSDGDCQSEHQRHRHAGKDVAIVEFEQP